MTNCDLIIRKEGTNDYVLLSNKALYIHIQSSFQSTVDKDTLKTIGLDVWCEEDRESKNIQHSFFGLSQLHHQTKKRKEKGEI